MVIVLVIRYFILCNVSTNLRLHLSISDRDALSAINENNFAVKFIDGELSILYINWSPFS